MKEKDIPRLSHDSRSDLVKGILLLLCNETIAQVCLPVPSHLWHALEIFESLARSREKLLDKIEAIIPNLFRSGVFSNAQPGKLVSKVITNMISKLLPQCPWICRNTVTKNGDKQMAKLMTCCHMPCLC